LDLKLPRFQYSIRTGVRGDDRAYTQSTESRSSGTIRTTIGWARAQLGNANEGVALIRQGLAGFAKIGSRLGITDRLNRLAELRRLDGEIDDALMTIEEALQANPEELVFRRPDECAQKCASGQKGYREERRRRDARGRSD
jgi:hypothetical protein